MYVVFMWPKGWYKSNWTQQTQNKSITYYAYQDSAFTNDMDKFMYKYNIYGYQLVKKVIFTFKTTVYYFQTTKL